MSSTGSTENNKSKVKENTFSLIAASVLDKAFFFGLMIYFTRYMGAAVYGNYLLAMSFLMVFRMLVNFGMNRLLVRNLARDFTNAGTYIGSSILISAGLSAVFYFLLILTGKFMQYDKEFILLLAVAGLSLLPYAAASLFESVLHALQYITLSSFLGVINSFLSAVSIIAVLHLGYGLQGVFIAMIIVSLIYMSMLYVSLSRLDVRIKLNFEPAVVSDIIKKTFPFAMFIMMRMIYFSLGIIMLSKLASSEMVGWYGAPLRFTEILLIIPGSLSLALFPAMSRHYKSSIDRLWQSYEKALRCLIIVGMPLCVSIALLSGSIVPVVFGEKFLPSVPVMTILVMATLVMFIKSPSPPVILNSDYFHRFIWVYMIYLSGTVVIYYLLISRYSYIGAGIAKLLTECIMLTIQLYFMKLVFNRKPNLIRLSIRPLLATGVMGAGIYAFHSLPLVFLIVSAFPVYFLALFISGEFTKDELSRIRDVYLNIRIMFGRTSSR